MLTKEYKVRFGKTEKITMEQCKEISDFLLTSTLPKDMNRLFEPYNKSVKRIGIEKAFFTTKNELLKYCRITSDMSLIPSKIIDFVTWVELEKNKTTHSNMYNSYPSGYAPYSCRYTYKKNTDL